MMAIFRRRSPRRKGHRWRFSRFGGVDQVVFRNGEDVARLADLDIKLWMALCMPTRGLALDARTASLLDTDQDGFIRPPELLAAVAWCKSAFTDLDGLLDPSDRVELERIRDPWMRAGARRILDHLGRPEATAITLADVASRERIFVNTRFNGDGVVPPASADAPEVAAAIEDIIRVCGGVPDRSGRQGVDAAVLDRFLGEAAAALDWMRRGREDPALFPLSPEATAAAAVAVGAVAAKVDDFFARCRLASFDDRAVSALDGDPAIYQPFGMRALSATAAEIADLPLARVRPDAVLPLEAGVNPAWSGAVSTLRTAAVHPLLGECAGTLAEPDWRLLRERLSAYGAWQAAKPPSPVITLGEARLEALLDPSVATAIRMLIEQDDALKTENAQIENIEKLVRFQRDLYEVLTNYVNFSDFYGQTYALFQTGSLYVDARVCHLCIAVEDVAAHAALAARANAYLAYCDLRRGAELRRIVAVVTDGASHQLCVGRNGVFYDREGRDWNATVTRIVSNPISIREAFWMPYRKLIRLVEEQIEKRAQAAETASMARMQETASTITTADTAKTAPPPAGPKKIELGAIALIGTAIGGISALVGGFLQALFGLGFWLPLGLLGVILLISGPSMLLAALKLKQRNLGPILDANGWAVNARARMNPVFGAALTELARLPPGSERSLEDPYAPRRIPWRMILLLAILAATAGAGWRLIRCL